MPIKIDAHLPAKNSLEGENIFVMTHERAISQDIRPLKILILNLMPTKIETETQLLRLLSNSPIQVEIELLQTATHQSRHTSAEHMLAFYKTFDDIKHNKYDGMVVTGAPVEKMEFEDVSYWDELVEVKLFKDNDKYKDDLTVTHNGVRIKIPRGETVYIKRKYALIIKDSLSQDRYAAKMIKEYVSSAERVKSAL